jgi:hypothetical protein
MIIKIINKKDLTLIKVYKSLDNLKEEVVWWILNVVYVLHKNWLKKN